MDHVEPPRADQALMESRLRPPQAARAQMGVDIGAVARGSVLFSLARAFRLHQWAKNLLIFVPILLAGKLHSAEALTACILGFIAFGILASSTYLVNDLSDLRFDRRHWSKWARPLANREISVRLALIATGIGSALSLGIAASVDRGAAMILVIYGLLTLLYSFRLKRVPMLDVFVLAMLFTLRLVFGIYLAKVVASPWLLIFSMFLFISLSLGKRFTEVTRAAAIGYERLDGRGYVTKDGPLLFGLGLSTGVGATLIMVLYLLHEAFSAAFYKSPLLLWALPAILFLWLGRYWLLAGRNQLDDDPLLYAIRDRISLALGAAMSAVFMAAWQL